MGALGQGALAAQFVPRVAVELRPTLAKLYAANSSASVIVGDITEFETIKKVYEAHPKSATISAGISCQPYSKLGDEKSGRDSRASTLPATLAAAHYLRAVVVILECVAPAGEDAYVRWHVEQFCRRTNFSCSEIVIDLQEVWPCKRKRWWCVLSALGKLELQSFFPMKDLESIRHVMPSIKAWPKHEESQLRLTPIETEAFAGVSGTPSSYCINLKSVLPCALHAWGAQLTPCPCGCREVPFSRDRLVNRGLYGVLALSKDSTATHEGARYRHLHPAEAAALCGLDPVLTWDPHQRLVLGAIGQLASPLQAFWVCMQVQQLFQVAQFGETCIRLRKAFGLYRAWLLARAEMVWENENQKVLPSPTLEQAQMWKPVVTARIDQLVNADRNIEQCADQIANVQVELQKKSLPLGLEQVEAVGEEWLKSVEDLTSMQVAIPSPPSESSKELESVRSPTSVVSSAASETIVIKITTQVGEQPVVTAAYTGITVQQIVEAEMSIGDWHSSHSKIVICDEDGNVMSPKSPVMHDVHLFVEESVTEDMVDCGNENPIPSLCNNQIGKDEHAIGSSYASPLTQLKGQAFLRLKPPQVSSESQVQSLRAQKQLATDRCVMLDHQGMIWGDDEIVWHLQRIQGTCKKEMLDQEMNDEIPAWIDPLLFQGWVFHNDVCEVKQWHKSRDNPSLFFTVAINQSHWIPVIFRIQDKVFSISFLQTWPVDLQFVKQVANILTESFECTSCAMHPVQIPSVPESCGTAAILFLEEFLLVSPTPEHIDYPEMHSHYRAMFCEALKTCTPGGRGFYLESPRGK